MTHSDHSKDPDGAAILHLPPIDITAFVHFNKTNRSWLLSWQGYNFLSSASLSVPVRENGWLCPISEEKMCTLENHQLNCCLPGRPPQRKPSLCWQLRKKYLMFVYVHMYPLGSQMEMRIGETQRKTVYSTRALVLQLGSILKSIWGALKSIDAWAPGLKILIYLV